MKRLLIIEDKASHRKRLQQIITAIPTELFIYEADNIAEAYRLSMEISIDLFLIDIVMDSKVAGDLSGLVFADRMRNVEKYRFTPMIFITSLEDPRMYAYRDIHCYGYIEKPFDPERVEEIIKEALMFPKTISENRYYLVKKDGVLYPKRLKDIVYIENSQRRLKIVAVDEVMSAGYQTCKRLLEEIDSNDFVQCNRSCIVNKSYISNFDIINRYITLSGEFGNLEIGSVLKNRFLQEMKNV